MQRFVIALTLGLLVGPAAVAHAQSAPRPRTHRAPPVIIVVPSPYYVAPTLTYDYYYQQELAKRQAAPRPTQSYEGGSPRCTRFFCEESK